MQTRTINRIIVAGLLSGGLCVSSVYALEGVVPTFKTTDTFVFEVTEKDAAADTLVVKGATTGYVPGISDREVVSFGETAPCGDRTCFRMQIDAVVPAFLPGQKEKPYDEKIVAQIDSESGELVGMTSQLKHGNSTSTTTHGPFDRSSMVSNFYGPWMLDLKDGYEQVFKRARGQIELKVVGREAVAGRQCFVVERTERIGEKVVGKKTLWVDMKSRHMVKVSKQGRTLSLATDSDVGKNAE